MKLTKTHQAADRFHASNSVDGCQVERCYSSRGTVYCTAILAAAISLLGVTGCGQPIPENQIDDHELSVVLPDANADVVRQSGHLQPPMISHPASSAASRSVSFAHSKRSPIRWGFKPLRTQAASTRLDAISTQNCIDGRSRDVVAVQLVQNSGLPPLPPDAGSEDFSEEDAVDEDAGVGPSSSDRGPVEIIPTPRAQPEIKAEIIPTPQGIPEGKSESTLPMARIAADPETKKVKTLPADANAVPDAGELIPAKAPSGKPPVAPNMARDLEIVGLTGIQDGPEDYQAWSDPDVVLFITGDQHGYIEPCGCTGLDKQKGGVARRYTLMEQLRGRGWDLVPIDAGNQIRRVGQQAAMKFEASTDALKKMKYRAVGLGPTDLRLGAGNLISYVFSDDPETAIFQSGNVVVLDPSLLPTYKIIEQGNWKIGVTSLVDPKSIEGAIDPEVKIGATEKAAYDILEKMVAEGTRFRVLTYFGSEESAKNLVRTVEGYDLIVVSGGYGEPTYRPQSIAQTSTKMIVTGNKGMYSGLVALYEKEPFKYARVALTHDFKDAPEMRDLMRQYQKNLEQVGLSVLGLKPIPHPSGEKFVGSAACGKCHTEAMSVWESTGHAFATDHIVKPPKERGDIARHFDPECISCHVTGWNPQRYYPYQSGYLSLEESKHLHGNGCENCHGPGSSHVKAEAEGSQATEEEKKKFRLAMQLPLEKAKEHCMECHDLDNSPDFHDEGAFENNYWPSIEHYGTD